MKSPFANTMLAVLLLVTSLFSCDTLEIAPFKAVADIDNNQYRWLIRSQDSSNWYTADTLPVDNWEYGYWISVEVCGGDVVSHSKHRSFIAGIHDIYIDENTMENGAVQIEINLSRQILLVSKDERYEELAFVVLNDSTIDVMKPTELEKNFEPYTGIHRVERYQRGIVLIRDESDSLFLRKID